jgi:hypothetical protein
MLLGFVGAIGTFFAILLMRVPVYEQATLQLANDPDEIKDERTIEPPRDLSAR